jgi:monomeric sarcosine oxidase
LNRIYDVAIVGAGVFGSWLGFHLQQAGLRVALIDAYGAGNGRASSGGESRIIRMGYGPEEIYTRWAQGSLEQWRDLSERSDLPLFHQTGVLSLAREDDAYSIATAGTLRNAGIEFEELRGEDLASRFPQMQFAEEVRGIYEPGSGALMAARAVQTLVHRFEQDGGAVLTGAACAPAGSGHANEILTRTGARIQAGVFVFACGAWLPGLFPDLLQGKLHPTRQEVFFFGAPAGDTRFLPGALPVWIDFSAEVYGFPDLEGHGFKISFDRHGPPIDPDRDERQISPALLDEIRAVLAARFPAMKGTPLIETRVCQYENTWNGDFLIDRHPAFDNVWLAGGGSGHGFKHGPALGEYLAEKILHDGETEARFRLAGKQNYRQRSIF